MTDYKKLVEALRCENTGDDECGSSDCPYWSGLGCMDGQLMEDAAAAIEALQALLPKRGEWVFKKDGDSGHHECSVCKGRELYTKYGHVVLTGFCPHCGADLWGVRYDEKMEVQE